MGSTETSFTAPGRPRINCVSRRQSAVQAWKLIEADATAGDRQSELPGRVQSDTPFEGSMPSPELRVLWSRTATVLTQAT
jgi:hypothetical protein